MAFREDDKAFFVYGFRKNERSNVSDRELRALKSLASELLSYSRGALAVAAQAGELIEIVVKEDD